MKRAKKLMSLLMALVMVFAMTAMAVAANVTNATSGHTYVAYQIFSGTQAAPEGVLGDIQWGNGVNSTALLTALKAELDDFDECETAADVAAVLSENSTYNHALAKVFANIVAQNLTTTSTTIEDGTTQIATGYYLLVDTTNVDGTQDARNSALLEVVNDITIESKYNVPTVDKDIVENSTEVEATDKNIGDEVTFKLTGTLPSNYGDYETYTYIFRDTLSNGLTPKFELNETDSTKVISGVKVTIDSADVTSYFEITLEGNNLTVACENLKEIKQAITSDSTVIVTYTATLNSDAVIGSAGNPNKVKLEYSNDPNYNGDGTDEPTGETPEDVVLVFTYELDVTKTDGTDEVKLKDAEFVLFDSTQTKVAKFENSKLVGWGSADEITKNDDGTYPAEYTLKSGDDGLFAVVGLDAGTYYLKETKAPAGYNLLIAPIKIVITATVDQSEDNPALTALTISVDDAAAVNGVVETGVVSMNVKNNSGAQLPETGGVGTTMLYVGGGVLVLAAVVLLITKKRMSAK